MVLRVMVLRGMQNSYKSVTHVTSYVNKAGQSQDALDVVIVAKLRCAAGLANLEVKKHKLAAQKVYSETACIPIAGLTILLWPVVGIGSVIMAVFSSFLIGLYVAVIVYQVWQNVMKACEIRGKELLDGKVITLTNLDDWLKAKHGIDVAVVHVDLPCYTFLRIIFYSIKVGSDGLFLLEDLEITHLNRPKDRLLYSLDLCYC
ncbi:hypothetical protein FXO37_02444 [Capsicum annuum]|nr:hypothetical protein FXO37_02444 [Capsicum annuum]